MEQTAYLAPLGFEKLLVKELTEVIHVFDRLVLAKGLPQKVYFVQNIWYNPQFITISSIGDAAKSLRAIQRNWWPYAFQHFRRMELITKNLPHLVPKPLKFLQPYKTSPLGSWTLIDENTMLASGHCESPMPNGEWNFEEDKLNPPSRAYLKLWELFTRFGVYPKKSDICLDLGACPGGWTYVLANLAKYVFAFDRSPLNPRVMALKNVTFKAVDAFKVDVSHYEEATWIFSDVICFPHKLYDFVTYLLASFPQKNYVFTVKFQGPDNIDIISRFAKLPGHLVHLSQNKHELTWFKINALDTNKN